MDLTPRQQQAYDLRSSTKPPMPWHEVGATMGISEHAARQSVVQAKRKLASPHIRRTKRILAGSRIEYTDPEKAAKAIDEITNPLAPTRDAALRATGLPKSTARDLEDRLQRDYEPAYEQVMFLKTETLIKAFEQNAMAALSEITPEKMKKMSPYQLTVMAAISVDKKLLLEGKPTQNVSLTIEDRRSLTDLMATIIKVAEARGFVKEVNPDTNEAHLAVREDATIETVLPSTSLLMAPVDHEND